MNKPEALSKLRTLLERVRSRARGVPESPRALGPASIEPAYAAPAAPPALEVGRSVAALDLPAAEHPNPPAPDAVLEPEEPTRTVEAIDDSDQAPASSRRPVAPVAEDHLARMAFGAEESQTLRHTPPPESGRLPSASVEDFDDAIATAGAPVEKTGRKVISHLVAEAARANLEGSEAVVDALSEARRFAPATFVELLDASLALFSRSPGSP